MYIFQHFFESQENVGVGVRVLLTLSVVVSLPLNCPSGIDFIDSGGSE